jgi:O-antigen/teichoic acid export membrane protein
MADPLRRGRVHDRARPGDAELRRNRYAEILHSSLYWSLAITTGALGVVSLALALAPLDDWFQLKLTPRSVAAVVATLLAVRVLTSIPQGLIAGIYRTLGEFPRGRMITNLQRILFFALSIAAVMAGGGLRTVAAVQLIPWITGVAFAVWDLRRRHPEISLGIERRNLSLAISLLGPSSQFLLIQLGVAVSLQGSTLMVGTVLGSAAVAVFVIQRTLVNLIRQLASSITNALWPEITVLEYQSQHAKLQRVHLLMVKTLLAISVATAIFLHFGGRDLFELWTRNRVDYDPVLMDAFLLLLILQTPWLVSSTLLTATNHLRLLAVCQLLSGVLGLVIGYALIGTWGTPGLVAGLLIADVVVCGGWIPREACRLIQQSVIRYGVEVVLRGLPVAAAVFGIAWLVQPWLHEIHPVTRLAALGLLVAAVLTPSSYFVWMNREERRTLLDLLRRS